MSIDNGGGGASTGLTDAELRATPVPVTIPTPTPVSDNSGSLTVDGTIAVSNFPATQPISAASLPLPTGVSTETTLATLLAGKSSTSAVTSVTGSATTVQLLAANTNRRMASFYNDSTADLFLKLGTTASTTSFTVKITSQSFYELPLPAYTGRIDGIWSTANGTVYITELT